jgi:hypothetical protein
VPRDRLPNVLFRTKALGLKAVGKATMALDSFRVQPTHQSEAGGGPLSDSTRSRATNMLAAIAHWSSDTPSYADRFRYLAASIDSLLTLEVDRLEIVVLTNSPDEVGRRLRDRYIDHYAVEIVMTSLQTRPPVAALKSIAVVGWSPPRLKRPNWGHYLTWAHKGIFEQALNNSDISLFLYLEDDIKFTNDSLRYWYKYRNMLATYDLLPGYIRVERKGNSGFFIVDQDHAQSLKRPRVVCPKELTGDGVGELTFIGLDNPYQGMYVLDLPLARYHFEKSAARENRRSSGVSPWGIRERAAIGPIFDNVPLGFKARNVVPVRQITPNNYELAEECFVEHLAGNYSRASESGFGKIKVEDLFL